MTRAEIDAIQERCDKATPGPWIVHSSEGPVWLPSRKALPRECLGGWTMSICRHEADPSRDGDHRCVATAVMRKEGDAQDLVNAELMAHAREDIPALLAEVDRLRAMVCALGGTP